VPASLRGALETAALAALLAAPAAAQENAPAPARSVARNEAAMREDYREAFQSYARGDYRGALVKWNAILENDPQQKTALQMIVKARVKVRLLTAELRRRTLARVAEGEYRQAFLELQRLLDQDPNDPQLLALQSRLSNVIKLVPRLPPRTKAARAAVLGLKGYLSLPPDLTLAHDALRYAEDLAPGSEFYKKLLAVVYAEYPVLATADPVAPGMTLLQFKSDVAINQIYDAKYHLAVLTLDEILRLEPNDLLALKRLGSAYYALGLMKEARAAWSAALKLQPDNALLRRYIAKTRAARRAPARTYTNTAGTP
jgi:tetratricopeptide (TPR) repeat protein